MRKFLSLPVLSLINSVGADVNHKMMNMDPTLMGLTPVEYKTDVTVIEFGKLTEKGGYASMDYYIKKKVYSLPDGSSKTVNELHGNCYLNEMYLNLGDAN